MLSSRTAFLVVSVLFQVAKCSLGETNVTQTPSPPQKYVECVCTGCEDSWGSCKGAFGCFTMLKPDDKKTGYDVTKGCIENALNHMITCENAHHPVYCCDEYMCNWNVTPPFPTTQPVSSPSKHGKSESTEFILLSIFAPVAALIVGIMVVCLVYQLLQKRQHKNGRYPNLRYVRHATTVHENGCCTVTECGKCSASKFSKFAQRTAAQDLDLIQVIGEGRYGKVWRALWHGDDVVAKLYVQSEEKFFKNEVDVNNKVGNHENILRVQHCHTSFLWNKVTYRCIVMEFHENGSLYDFLNHRPVSIEEMCSLALSAARGLNHLHGEIYGRKEKYSIAHCDIKSKNIMVKSNLTCAIGSLGLAVVHDRSQDKIITEDKRRGTARYMAPEVLDGSVVKSFESYKRADVYSFGLVLWEITRRTFTEGIRPEHYELPFYDMVTANPSYDEMKKVVTEQEKRPLVPNRWTENSALEVMGKLMKDCWKQNASARLPSLRVKKTLSKLMEMVKPSRANTSLSEELSAFQDVNIHIPETCETAKV